MDNCLEKNIYDRQVKKQGMSDRVVDECNPDAHLSIRELTNLCYDKVEEDESTEFKQPIENYSDEVMRSLLTKYKSILSKEPFYHESLLIDRKEKKLSQTEKKLAKRGYEIEKKASSKPHHFIHNIHNVHNVVPNRDCMMNKVNSQIFKNRINQPFKNSNMKLTRWIPAEVWQRQGMSSQEMKLPIDVAIPTNSNDSTNIVVKAGEKVMVLNSTKGVYMQLESGKIIAIKTSAEAAKDKMQQVKKLTNSQLIEKKCLPTLDALPFQEDTCRAGTDQASEDSENDDCIVINDSINDSLENSFDLSYISPKNRVEQTPVKQNLVPESFQNNMLPILKEAQKNKLSLLTQNLQLRKEKPDAITQKNSYLEDKLEPIIQGPHLYKEKLTSAIPNHQFRQNKLDIPTQNHQYRNENPELLIKNHPMRQDKPAVPCIQSQHDFEPKSKSEPSPSANFVHKQRNYLYGSASNYDILPVHNPENQHFSPLSTPQRWENKSPELYKQAFKISNIPAPYPSTAVCDLSGFDKNEKRQESLNESIKVGQYNPPPPSPYVPTCKDADRSYPPNLNYNLCYQHNPHPAGGQPSSEDNGSLNTLYNFNNNNDNVYSENLYENSDSSHSNYHQQMSKYSYGYYHPPYLPTYERSNNKAYDNNARESASSQYYMRRPSTFSTSSTNGVDVGFNYAAPQGWMKKHHPE